MLTRGLSLVGATVDVGRLGPCPDSRAYRVNVLHQGQRSKGHQNTDLLLLPAFWVLDHRQEIVLKEN